MREVVHKGVSPDLVWPCKMEVSLTWVRVLQNMYHDKMLRGQNSWGMRITWQCWLVARKEGRKQKRTENEQIIGLENGREILLLAGRKKLQIRRSWLVWWYLGVQFERNLPVAAQADEVEKKAKAEGAVITRIVLEVEGPKAGSKTYFERIVRVQRCMLSRVCWYFLTTAK